MKQKRRRSKISPEEKMAKKLWNEFLNKPIKRPRIRTKCGPDDPTVKGLTVYTDPK